MVGERPEQRHAAATIRESVEQRMGKGAEEEKRERSSVAASEERKQRGTGEGEDDRMREAAMTVWRAVRNPAEEPERVEVGEDRGDDRGNGHARRSVPRLQKRDCGV